MTAASKELTLSHSFVEALASLAPSEGRRATAFLDKLLHSPDALGLHSEIVHDAVDRSIRSFRVTHDLRAIAHVEGAAVTLLYVDQHDAAYRWARNYCVECHPVTGEIRIVEDLDPDDHQDSL